MIKLGYTLKKVLNSDFFKIRQDLEHMIGIMKREIKDDDLFFDARLILDELICNGVLHGNDKNISKMIEVSIDISEKDIRIKVSDEGHGFEYDRNKYDPCSLESSGRGLCLVDGLSDELHIDNNTITSIKYIGSN